VDLDDDISDVVVTLTDRPTTLKGSVRTSAGSADTEADVIVFPVNPLRWSGFSQSPLRIRNVRTDANGAYLLTGLPPGDYFVAAISDASAGGWQSAKFLESLSRQAVRVTLAESAPVTQDLKRVEIK
jgi:hypothetical protein